MEKHSYESLYKVIKAQYPNSKSNNNYENNLYNAYSIPTFNNIFTATNTIINKEPQEIQEDNIENYIYIHPK